MDRCGHKIWRIELVNAYWLLDEEIEKLKRFLPGVTIERVELSSEESRLEYRQAGLFDLVETPFP